ncbi:MAG: hypothetical protein JO257_09375 [Deltaproteobacteria bacterium]|nr:hypothetical protein [Deltaproteobacteria bacterium]
MSSLDRGDWQRKSAALAARALELRRLRRTVVVRGSIALGLSMAAALVLWLFAPKPQAPPPTPHAPSLLDWATHDTDPTEVLRYAQ